MVGPCKRDDLIDAYAATEWAEAQLPHLEQVINEFLTSEPYRIAKRENPDGEGVVFLLEDVKALPQALNAHAGAIVNSIRSSLDLLSAALARRNGKTPSSDTHFPIWTNPNDFADPMWGVHGTERKKWLTENERRIIESLKPYPGGDDDLVALHWLDIIRKHERLLGVTALPGSIRIDGEAVAAGVRRASHWPAFREGAVLALSCPC